MDDTKGLNHNMATAGWGALLIWWGVAIMADPITIGIGALGTGLILLGINAARSLKAIPTRRATTTAGILLLAWGVLDTVRSILGMPGGLSFALVPIVVGGYLIVSLAVHPKSG